MGEYSCDSYLSHVTYHISIQSDPVSGEAPPTEAALGADQDKLDQEMLGLPSSEPEKALKRRRLSGPRVKRSREEVFDDETDKIQAKFQDMLDSMRQENASMPTGAVCAKHLRAIQTKCDEARAAGMFQCVSTLESLTEKCTLVKEALRVAQLYINPSGTTKKNHEDVFIAAFEKLPVPLLHKFPDVMTDRYYHVIHAKDNAFCWVGWTDGVTLEFIHWQRFWYNNINN